MSKSFDVVVIGAGPGGYVAAIRCAQLGLSTAVIDAWKKPDGKPSLGGTCLNVGCIPSKALLESSENYERALHSFADHGITVGKVSMDVPTMLARKDKIVDMLTGGIGMLFKKNKITHLPGVGSFAGVDGKWQIKVDGDAGSEIVSATHVIVATGSVPRAIPGIKVDNDLICDNEGALNFKSVPKALGVIGAGVIGLELGSVWRRLGSEVTVLEGLPTFLAAVDEQIAKEAWKKLTGEGLSIKLGCKITGAEAKKKQVVVSFEGPDGAGSLTVDKLVVAVGRGPNTAGLNAEAVGLKLTERGTIEVDDHCRTNLPNVWAVGDVVRGPMLAHKASEEGVAVAERIAGQAGHVNMDTIPWVIYTHPEIAWVGRSEAQLKEAGIEFRKGVSRFNSNGRALGLGAADGLVKILACAATDRILGVHIIGPFASELIAEAVVAMEFSASSEDLARIVHAHPSLSEVTHEAALAVDKRPLHG